MMSKFSYLNLLSLCALSPVASAHSGHGAHSSLSFSLLHYFSDPVHSAVAAAAVILVITAIYRQLARDA
jgi:hypothetical protein